MLAGRKLNNSIAMFKILKSITNGTELKIFLSMLYINRFDRFFRLSSLKPDSQD